MAKIKRFPRRSQIRQDIETESCSVLWSVCHLGKVLSCLTPQLWVDLASAYVACKHAVVGLTKIAASEYGGYGVRVNAVCPGTTLTGPTKDLSEEYLGALTSGQPIKRIADPKEISEVVVWLLSSNSPFVSGRRPAINGHGYRRASKSAA